MRTITNHFLKLAFAQCSFILFICILSGLLGNAEAADLHLKEQTAIVSSQQPDSGRGLQKLVIIASLATSGVTTFTLFFIVWYTIETARLRKTAKTQSDALILPIIVLSFTPQRNKLDDISASGVFLLRNVGNGPAFNVHVLPIKFSEYALVFDLISVLEKSSEIPVSHWIETAEERKTGISVHTTLGLATSKEIDLYPVRVCYSNIAGVRYRAHHLLEYTHQIEDISVFFTFAEHAKNSANKKLMQFLNKNLYGKNLDPDWRRI